MLEWAGMLILISHHLTLKSPIHDCCTSSIMCSYTIPTVMDHPSGNVAECSGNDTRRKTQSNPGMSAEFKTKKKHKTWISTLWFLQSIFLPSSLFLESFLKKGLSGSVTGHTIHALKEGILFLFMCTYVTRSFLDTLARMVSLKKMKIHHKTELYRICNTWFKPWKSKRQKGRGRRGT